MEFTVSTRQLDDHVVVILDGELDLSSKERVAACVSKLLAAGRTSIRADLSRLTFCDSSGLAVLIRAKRLCERAGGSFGVLGAVGDVANLLRITGLDTALRSQV
jgi:anti-sigma B factor antagonist